MLIDNLAKLMAHLGSKSVESFTGTEILDLADAELALDQTRAAETYTIFVGFREPKNSIEEYKKDAEQIIHRDGVSYIIDHMLMVMSGSISPLGFSMSEYIGTSRVDIETIFSNQNRKPVKTKLNKDVVRMIKVYFYPTVELAKQAIDSGKKSFPETVFTTQ